MNPLFAHHIEPQHYPVLAVFLAVGFWFGWHLVSKLLARGTGPHQRSEVDP
ncbi:MAG TPA: hypothetical protein VMF69_17245 [Gemmataceae bacterium]|nr:hypothetical protein [Gemmataceae bacterium]